MLSTDFIFRYALLLIGSIILLRVIYFRASPNRESVFSFFLFANGVFLITYFLHNIDLSMGFAFGLFAVFAMLRYRTEPIAIRDMTYLFVIIGFSLMTALSNLAYIELFALGTLICALSAIGETRIIAPHIVEKKITYDNVSLIKPECYQELLEDLHQRTGFNIEKIEIGEINYLTDSVRLIIFCSEPRK